MEKLPISVLARRFGNIGRRIWYMAQGADPDPLNTEINAPKSLGHGKVMPRNTKDRATLLVYLQHMCERVAARLRRHQFQAQTFYIGWRKHKNSIGIKHRLAYPTQDGRIIYALGVEALNALWHGEALYQVQVTALDPLPQCAQGDLFEEFDKKTPKINQVMDAINDKFGEFKIAPAKLLLRSKMNNVIAPAWKPDGHRQSI